MIRETMPEDTEALIALAAGTEVFKPAEIKALREVLDDYFGMYKAEGHRCVTLEHDGGIAGFLYYAPAAMTDRTWTVWWIAIRNDMQARGLGALLLDHVENDIRARAGRLVTIETGGTPKYELTRRFYAKYGYIETARVADFYADLDDLVIFRKRL